MMGVSKRTYVVSTAFALVIIWVIVGMVSYRYLEDWTWVQSLYFTVVTLTTIGYGDLHPTTEASQLFTVFYIIFGVFSVLGAVSIIGDWRITRKAERKQHRHEKDQQDDLRK